MDVAVRRRPQKLLIFLAALLVWWARTKKKETAYAAKGCLNNPLDLKRSRIELYGYGDNGSELAQNSGICQIRWGLGNKTHLQRPYS